LAAVAASALILATPTVASAANPTLSVTNPTLPVGTVGVSYSQQIEASGGTAPYTFVVVKGAVPPGLSVSSSGLVSGLPTAQSSYPVQSEFYVDVAGQGSGPTLQNQLIELTVQPQGYQAPAPLSVSPTTVPDAVIGKAYAVQFTTTGGTPGYTWQLGSYGSLPSGFSFSSSGLLSGKSSQLERSSFSIGVVDSGVSQSLGPYQSINTQQGDAFIVTLTVGTGNATVDGVVVGALQGGPGDLGTALAPLLSDLEGVTALLSELGQQGCLEYLVETLLGNGGGPPQCYG
jgi:hypothetical protein